MQTAAMLLFTCICFGEMGSVQEWNQVQCSPCMHFELSKMSELSNCLAAGGDAWPVHRHGGQCHLFSKACMHSELSQMSELSRSLVERAELH